MNAYEETLKGIKEIATQMRSLQDRAYALYSQAVERIISGEITSKKEIDRLLDYMMDFDEDERFRALVGKLCSFLLQNRPDVVGPYETLYRLQAEPQYSEETDDL